MSDNDVKKPADSLTDLAVQATKPKAIKKSAITPQEARAILWKQGNIAEFLLDSSQLAAYKEIKLNKRRTHVLVLSRQSGKCIAKDTLVATPSGSVKIQDIKVGDYVIGYNSEGTTSPVEVTQFYSQGIKQTVDLYDGGRFLATCTLDHRWLTYNTETEEKLELSTSEILNNPQVRIVSRYGYTGVIETPTRMSEGVDTYDIGVNNDTHLYCLANGLVTHNSWTLLTIAIEECLRRPGITICYVTPRINQGKKIIDSTFQDLLASCPEALRPVWVDRGSKYEFANKSKIELYGFNSEEVEAARGPKAHLIIVDECGFMDNLKYGLRSVLYPKLNSTKGSMLLCSTLPKSPGHEFYEIVKKAEYDGILFKRDIFSCPRYTKQDIDTFAEEVGGFDSSDFKREYLNIMAMDDERAVVPEFTEDLEKEIVRDWKRPPYFDCYVGMDIGGKDFTALCFGYYDFHKGILVIEDEIAGKGNKITTSTLATTITDLEQKLWAFKKPYVRISDNNNQILLNDLATDYGIYFKTTAKDNKIAWLNEMRTLIADKRIIISPRCKTLIRHLKNGIWNKRKTDYERDVDGSHCDMVDALCYLVRNVAWNKNPYPAGYGMPTSQDMFNGLPKSSGSDLNDYLVTLYRIKK